MSRLRERFRCLYPRRYVSVNAEQLRVKGLSRTAGAPGQCARLDQERRRQADVAPANVRSRPIAMSHDARPGFDAGQRRQQAREEACRCRVVFLAAASQQVEPADRLPRQSISRTCPPASSRVPSQTEIVIKGSDHRQVVGHIAAEVARDPPARAYIARAPHVGEKVVAKRRRRSKELIPCH